MSWSLDPVPTRYFWNILVWVYDPLSREKTAWIMWNRWHAKQRDLFALPITSNSQRLAEINDLAEGWSLCADTTGTLAAVRVEPVWLHQQCLGLSIKYRFFCFGIQQALISSHAIWYVLGVTLRVDWHIHWQIHSCKVNGSNSSLRHAALRVC